MEEMKGTPLPFGEDVLGAAGAVESIAAPGRVRYPALDGLRGAAILMVMACHYAMQVPGKGVFARGAQAVALKGWAGVDLFFVLSGFLITGILYDAKGQSHYFRNFYARRTLRIFPLYYGILVVELLILLVIKFGFPHAWLHLHNPQKLWAAMPWLWTYTTNIGQSFFHLHTVLEGHFWSLAVEEQFYLVWPLLVFLLPWHGLIKACAALVVTAFLVRAALAANASSFAAYSLTPCQFDALGLGALAALLVRDKARYAMLKRYAPKALVAGGLLLAVIIAGAVALKLNPTLLGSHSVRMAGGTGHGHVDAIQVPSVAQRVALRPSRSRMCGIACFRGNGCIAILAADIWVHAVAETG